MTGRESPNAFRYDARGKCLDCGGLGGCHSLKCPGIASSYSAFCQGGMGVCENCLDSCGISERRCETDGHEWVGVPGERTCPRCGYGRERMSSRPRPHPGGCCDPCSIYPHCPCGGGS